MGIFDFFTAKSFEKHERRADAFVIRGAYGHAKIEYEKALVRIERQTEINPGLRSLIEDKLRRCRESLAREHHREGKALAESGCVEDARELLDLALALTEDARLTENIRSLIEKIPDASGMPEAYEVDLADAPEEPSAEVDPGSDGEYFEALCNSLEDDEKEAYHTYPDTFKGGYLALNRGDFDTAVTLLSEAAAAYPFGANYISLELATAHLNRGENETARTLLESFLEEFPDSLRAYSLMCEILWEAGAYDDAERFLTNVPPELAASLPVQMLVGETRLRAGRATQAAGLYQGLIDAHGWDPVIAQALAGAYEAGGHNNRARDLYGEIIGTCTGCGSQVDPVVKQRFAETSFAAGDYSINTLELYLELVQADPDNRFSYYQKISHIYSHQGNDHEARRFAAFAKQANTGIKAED